MNSQNENHLLLKHSPRQGEGALGRLHEAKAYFMSGKALRMVLGMLTGLLIQAGALASDHIISQAYFEDTSNQMTFDEVRQQGFREYQNILSLGYIKSAAWIRIRIDPRDAPQEMPLVLTIRPPFLDRVELFDPAYGVLGGAVTGDEIPRVLEAYKSLNLTFTVPVGKGPRDLWLKVNTSSTMLFDIQARPLLAALKSDRSDEDKYTAYLAILFFFVLWGGLYQAVERDSIIGMFTLTQVFCLAYMAGALGFYRESWPFSNGLSSGTFIDYAVAFYIAGVFRLDYLLLREAGPNPRLLSILKWSALYLPTYLLLMILDMKQCAFQMSMAAIFCVTLLYLILAMTIPSNPASTEAKKPSLSRNTLIALYALIFAGLSLSSLPSMGLFSATSLVFDGFLFHSLLSGAAFTFVLNLRMRENLAKRVTLELIYQDAERRANDELEKRKEQSQLLAMLTHELRTSLSVVSMVLGAKTQTPQLKLAAEKSIHEMSALIDLCLNVDKHEAGRILLNLNPLGLVPVLQDLIASSSRPDRIHLRGDGDTRLLTDAFLLRMILANLIDNALKYSPPSSPVEIDVLVSPLDSRGPLQVMVTSAVGKAGQPDPDRIFQKYYRHPRAHAFTGTGLGLFLSAQLAVQLGGSLKYDPIPKKVRFILCLPHSALL